MHNSQHSVSKAKVTVRYEGDLRDGHDVNDNISPDFSSRATLTRRQHLQITHKLANLGSHVSASLHVVPRWSTNVSNPEVNISATESENLQEDAAMLLKTVHTDFSSAPVTALPAGIHFMCFVGPYSSDSTGPTASHVGKQLSFKEWPALWRDLWVDKSKYSNDEDLTWKSSCLELLKEVAISLGVAEVASVVEGVNAWARVPCKSSSPLCLLASGGENTPGNVMWFHLETQYAEAAASVVIHRLQGLTVEDTGAAFASIFARVAGESRVAITATAHSALSLRALSSYNLDPTSYASNNPRPSSSGGTGDDRTDIEFIKDSLLSDDVGARWFGTSAIEELPGGGLHRQVKTKISLSCKGRGDCSDGSNSVEDSENEWCTILLTQHIPQGAYIDVDEVKARHNFNIVASVPTRGKVMVETFGGEPIDIELPSSISSQHAVHFNFQVGLSKNEGALEGARDIDAELTLPVHLRYPDPACERRGEDCDYYAWVEVPPPLVGVRCDDAGGSRGFVPVLPIIPPTPVVLRIPRGILWHRGFVVWGTIGAAALGMLYTMCTLCMLSLENVGDASRRRTAKKHFD